MLATAGSASVSSHDSILPNAILPIWSLSVAGQWATQCPPVLQSVALDGNDLRIDARSVLELCAPQPTPYSIELNPALALQHGAFAPGVYHVSFYAADGAQVQPKLRAFTLIDRSGPDAGATTPETGFWSSDGSDRTLLSLELQGGQLSAALLSYDEDGQPAWLFGSAPYDGRIAHVSLLRLSGGNAPFAPAPSSPHGDAAMTLDLQFSTSAHAQVWLSRMRSDGSLQLRALEISRLPLAASDDGSAWQGEWVLVADAFDAVPQRLQLNGYQALDAQHFQLASADGAVALSCTRGAQAQNPTPRSCSLHLADGSISHFDSVAIGRMDGKNANGAVVHLLRITP
ncbi:MAG TPA: hypothetical protein VLK26_09895 [Rudaea sp.]|nr:hypothetical protein [Rudaea sp.]